MSAKSACADCINADKTRTKDGKIRCTRYSKWVYPFEDSCEEYVSAELWKKFHNNLTPRGKEMDSGKWLFDGDCLICNCCGKAIDYHPKWTPDQELIVPVSCPMCGDEKTEVCEA